MAINFHVSWHTLLLLIKIIQGVLLFLELMKTLSFAIYVISKQKDVFLLRPTKDRLCRIFSDDRVQTRCINVQHNLLSLRMCSGGDGG